jgi:hypothetical protein
MSGRESIDIMKFPQSVRLFDRLLVLGVLTGYWTMLQADHHVAGDWEVLFDGQSTEQFRAFKQDSFPSGGWKIEAGQLRTIKGGDEVDIITKDQYDDFELVFEWKVTPGGNSGVIYRVSESFDRPWHTGPEYQVLDDSLHRDGKNLVRPQVRSMPWSVRKGRLSNQLENTILLESWLGVLVLNTGSTVRKWLPWILGAMV